MFDDERGITLLDENPTEERYVTFGMDAQGRVLAVSYTLRGNTIPDHFGAKSDRA